MKLDYDTERSVDISSTKDLQSLFADSDGAVRVIGSGSKQNRLPAPKGSVTIASLQRMNKILRLDVEDMTCSVEPGLSRTDLDRALDEHKLQLPCPDLGSLGGMFAAGDLAPLAPTAHSTRSLLLGLEGLLVEGLPFKSGAKVVKSVAGFDLQKLFVGSRGKMFVATCLHLKLRRRPDHRFGFHREGLDGDAARSLFRDLRTMPAAPHALVFRCDQSGGSITGEFTGNARSIEQVVQRHDLIEGSQTEFSYRAPPPNMETLEGFVRPSRIEELLNILPAGADIRITGSGQFDTSLTPSCIDQVLPRLTAAGCSGEIRYATAGRRGLSTKLDSAASAVTRRLSLALDPNQRLA